MNRKGQVGKLITVVPIMILIFIIMGVFVFLSAAFSLGKTAANPVFADSLATQEDLMSKQITYVLVAPNPKDSAALVQTTPRQSSVLGAVALYWNEEDSASRQRLKDAIGLGLRELVNENAGCLFIFSAPMENPSRTLTPDYFFVRTSGGGINSIKEPNAVETNLNVMYKQSKAYMRAISFLRADKDGKQERIYVDYYYGGCF